MQVYTADSWQPTILQKNNDIFSLSVVIFKMQVYDSS